MGCLCQWELKAPTDRSRSDCVHEQVAKRIANVSFTNYGESLLGRESVPGEIFQCLLENSDVFNKNLINCSQRGQSFFVSYFKKSQDFLKG